MSNEKKEKRLSISKKRVNTQLIIMWVGVVLSILGMFAPEFYIGSISSRIIGIPGGIIAIVGAFMMIFGVKCPYCGGKKVGRNIGGTPKKVVECPDCKKKIDVK